MHKKKQILNLKLYSCEIHDSIFIKKKKKSKENSKFIKFSPEKTH